MGQQHQVKGKIIPRSSQYIYMSILQPPDALRKTRSAMLIQVMNNSTLKADLIFSFPKKIALLFFF